jgi:D-amino peptidase
MFVDYHSSTHNAQGVRSHTFSSARLTRVALNGKPVTEGAWNAAIAGQYGVQVIFLSGDDAAIAEVRCDRRCRDGRWRRGSFRWIWGRL